MNILFLTLVEITSINERGIYQDLLRKFMDEGHRVTIVTPIERRRNLPTEFKQDYKASILRVRTLNITKTNVFEKGIATFIIERQYSSAIKKYLKDAKYDLVLYSTPPITLTKTIKFIKKRDKCKSYLLLKDIFPQNAVDLGLMKKGGLLYRIFRYKEKELYQYSDAIGCMSEANVSFILNQNPEIPKNKVEVNPNSISPLPINYSESEKNDIKKKYHIPINQKIFVYGGNLGKPQGIEFLLEVIKLSKNPLAFFLIVGDGTEYNKVKKWFDENNPSNALLLKCLPKTDYDKLLAACDVGLIFLHPDFTIPNFPSRLLSYLEMQLPVITATDQNTDIGDVIELAKCGYKVLSGDHGSMERAISETCKSANYNVMKSNARKLLINNYTVNRSYRLIMEKLENNYVKSGITAI